MAIMTVCGPILSEQAGVTLAHEHLLCDLWGIVQSYDAILDDEELAARELQDYRDLGGRLLVDVTSHGLGRNPEALRRISERTGVHVVMGTGWYRERLYPPYVYEMDANALAGLLINELSQGVDGTSIRAGVIGEIGTDRHHISPAEERVFRACARAQRRTGVAITTHTTHFGELALEQIALLREEGVPADRIVISHLGDRLDTKGLLAIAVQGVFLSIDNIGFEGDGYPSDSVRAKNVALLITEGHLHQVLLSSDICHKHHLRAYGGKGYGHVIRTFLPTLMEMGVSRDCIYRMTVANPASAFDSTEAEMAASEVQGVCGRNQTV